MKRTLLVLALAGCTTIGHETVEDSIVVYGQTVEECQQAAQEEMRKRGWAEENCWSEPWD